ncbi:MAG: ArsI/CadI family heavy metal resistance metalloenzyme [Polyangiales bacterium]
MKRMHIHVGVDNLDESIKFYTALFGAEPTKVKTDYAKWMLDDPRLNFAISTRTKTGVDHLGLQVDDDDELSSVRERLKNADMALFGEGQTVCCYAESDKSWVKDPSGISWEAYRTMNDVRLFSSDVTSVDGGACCAPKSKMNSEESPRAGTKSGCCG